MASDPFWQPSSGARTTSTVKRPSGRNDPFYQPTYEKKVSTPKPIDTTRPAPTKSTIIIDDNTGKQVASIVQRGSTEADITRISPVGLKTTETIRGATGYVSQEVARVKQEYPKTVSEPTPSIQRAMQQPEPKATLRDTVYVPPEATPQLRKTLGQVNYPPTPKLKQVSEVTRYKQSSDQLYTEPFFSIRGQKQRLENVGATFANIGARLPFIEDKEKAQEFKIYSKTPEGRTERAVKYVAENPFESAFYLTGITGLYKTGAKALGSSARGISKVGLGKTGLSYAGQQITKETAKQSAKTVAKQFTPSAIKKSVTSYSRYIYGQGLVKTAVGATQKAGTGFATAYGAQKGTRKAGEIYTIDEEASKLLKQRNVDIAKITNQALAYETQEVTGKLVPGTGARRYLGIGGAKALSREWLPFGTVIVGDKTAFRQNAFEQYKALGYTDTEAKKLADVTTKQRYVRATAEAVGQLGVERASESTGRFLVTKQFQKSLGEELPKSGLKLGTQIGLRIGSAGILEGTAGDFLSAQARGEKFTKTRAITGATTGFVIGGSLGGFIGQRFARKGAKDKFARRVNIGANIVDIYEKPGDLLQDATEKIGARLLGRNIPQPQVKKLGKVRTFSVSTPTKAPTFTSFFARSVGTPATVKKSTRGTGGYTFDDAISGKIPVDIDIEGLTNKPPVPINPFVPIPIKVNNPIDIIGKESVWVNIKPSEEQPIPEEQRSQETTSTSTTYPTFTPIPTVVPGRAILGASLPFYGTGSGSGLGRGSRTTTVYDELQRNVNRFFGGVQRQMNATRPKKRKSSKKNYTKVRKTKKR